MFLLFDNQPLAQVLLSGETPDYGSACFWGRQFDNSSYDLQGCMEQNFVRLA